MGFKGGWHRGLGLWTKSGLFLLYSLSKQVERGGGGVEGERDKLERG